MKIILNGSMFINDKEVYFEDFEIDEGIDECENVKEEFDFADECDINKYIEDCEDCGFCDLEQFELDDFMDDIVEDYTDIIWEMGDTAEDVNEMLLNFLKEILIEYC